MKDVYKRQFKAVVSLINSTTHLEESTREFKSSVIMTPKFVSHGNVSTPRKVDPVECISSYIDTAISNLKEANKVIEQVFIKKMGKEDVVNMSYDVMNTVNEFYYLSTDDQKKVSDFVKELGKNSN